MHWLLAKDLVDLVTLVFNNVGPEGETEARVSTPYVSSVTLRSVDHYQFETHIMKLASF